MDAKSDQLQLKKILVDLEDEHKHLKASIGHLEHEIKKREIEIQKLVAERELQLAIEFPDRKILVTQPKPVTKLKDQKVKQDLKCISFSSDFTKQVGPLLCNINTVSEEVSNLIKLSTQAALIVILALIYLVNSS